MNKENKVFLGSWILISVIGIVIMVLVMMMPTEITTDVWVSDNAIITNEMPDGTYIDISEIQISGTAATISLEDYKEKYERGSFAKNEIVIDTSGIVHYIGSARDEIVYTAKTSCPNSIKFTGLKEVDIYNEEGLKIKKIYSPYGGLMIILSILVSILIVCVAGIVASEISDKHK